MAEQLARHTIVNDQGCWGWAGPVNNNGYAIVYTGNTNTGAHRARHLTERGPVPPGLVVMHDCDNKLCTNPAHLTLGTPAENTRQAEERGLGKHPRGGLHGNAKLNDADVLAIRAMVVTDRFAHHVIGALFGIHAGTVWKIAHRLSWAHLD